MRCFIRYNVTTRDLWILAELSRAKRVSGAPWVRKWSNLPIRENLVITWSYTDRLPARPSVRPQVYQCLLSHFLAILGAYWLHINVVINWQLSKQGTRQYHLTVSWAQVSTHPGRVFFEVIRWQVTTFQMMAGAFFLIHMKYVFISLLTFWFQTDLGCENSASYLKMQAGKTDAFHFSHHSHALVTPHVQFLCYDWSKFDRWVHAENVCSILKLVYFDSWSWQSFVSTSGSTCDVF